ncbi:hypothetical protein GLI01_06280 [Gluconacetobacter liquefaciens]|nr:hypothetical protein [Gluconacetobacter liquefaciens]GBQ94576.1 hypothetical protein AA0522_0434 [Gluconacetobacter liquefaciens NRIC 0522]GEB36593.1 hypothetical protein GLI01_06280 [Gluconacetobacter liquefaciens]
MTTTAPRRFQILEEGIDEAEEMLALVTMTTQPGAYRPRTHAPGHFMGIRDKGRLVAMVGERT